MKKSYITCTILIASCLFSFAQPVLNSTDFPANYSASIYFISNNQSLSPGNAGANQVWDFSTIIMPTQPSGGINLVPISTAPQSDSYPSSNYCMNITAGYNYYELSTTSYELIGYFWEDWNINYIYSNPEKIFQFPYTFNTVINDTYQTEGEVSSSSFTTTYDAYGTLILPYGTYNNVIRQKRTEGELGYTYYTFYNTNPFAILVAGNFLSNDSFPARFYKNNTVLSVNETNNENLISVYPNPVNTVINFKIANDKTIEKVIITDLAGKIVLLQNHNANLINVQNLSAGIYMLQVYSENKKYLAKFIKE